MEIEMHVRSTLVLAVVLVMAVMGVPVQAADQEPAGTADGPTPLADQMAATARTLVGQRSEPVRERPTVQTANVAYGFVQDYYDTCGDAAVGDLAGLKNIDTTADVGWSWSTCHSRPFHATGSELIMMYVYDMSLPYVGGPDYVIVQWPADGYFEVYYAGGTDNNSLWQLLGSDFGPTYGTADRVVAGEFIFDAATTRFPTSYEFAITAIGAEGAADTLPKPGHPMPVAPAECTIIVPLAAELVLDDHADGDGVVGMVETAGMSVQDTLSADHGIVIVDNVHDRDLAWLATLDGVDTVQRSRNVEPAQLADNWQLDQLGFLTQTSSVLARPAHIAVIDSGVDATHPALAGSMGAGFDAVSGQVVPAGRSNNYGNHGTAVASMIAGDGTSRVHGSNPMGIIRPINVTTHDGCMTSDRIANAIVAAAQMPEVRVINISIGGRDQNFAEQAAIDVAVANGKIVVAASGNDQEAFPGRPNYPASLPNVIGVGATTPNGTLASFSQVAGADIVAPGDNVRAAALNGSSELTGGTSFAAPLVAGVLSSWVVDNPTATVDQARAALVAAGVPVAGSPAPLLDVEALFGLQAAPGPEPLFTDIAGTTHEQAIVAVAAAGITGGYPDGTFRPHVQVTRGQMATFLTRALELAPGGSTFPDAIGTTHEQAIGAVAAAGITGGYPDGTFRPDVQVTRGQMATFLTRALQLAPGGSTFPDAVGTTHEQAIGAVAAAGITGGYPDGTFRPDVQVTRGQMAIFLTRALELGG